MEKETVVTESIGSFQDIVEVTKFNEIYPAINAKDIIELKEDYIFKFCIGKVMICEKEEWIFKSIRVIDDKDMICPDTPIISHNRITIKFSYPLSNIVELSSAGHPKL